VTKKKKPPTNCEKCGLCEKCENPKIKVYGKGGKGILIVAQSPDKRADEENDIFNSRAGKIVRRALKDNGLNLEEDCWLVYSVRCRNKVGSPTNLQVKMCRRYLHRVVRTHKPKKIITLGLVSLQGLIGHKESITAMEKWMGQKIPDQDFKCWIYPTYHPLYLLANDRNIPLWRRFKKQMTLALEHDQEFLVDTPDIEIISGLGGIEDLLIKLQSEEYLTVDFETSGLKPHAKGHFIYSMAFTTTSGKSYAFLVPHDVMTPHTLDLLKDLFTNPKIKLIGQNIKFETQWCYNTLGFWITNWYWDTMLATHVIDNRGGITGLKFQTCVKFGVSGYGNEMKQYFKTATSNAFNKIKEAPVEKMLHYNGLDTHYTYKLALDQMAVVQGSRIEGGYELLHEGILAFSKVEQTGIRVDMDYCSKTYVVLEKQMIILKKEIMESEEIKSWVPKPKSKTSEFNFNSTPQLKHLLVDILNIKSDKMTPGGGVSMDQEALGSIDIPFTNKILEYRKLVKLRDTYLKGIINETIPENNMYLLRCMFNLHTAITYRSSSSLINFQNMPKRDEVAKKLIRSAIIPREGNMLVGFDYSGVEVVIGCCYHKDENMIRYVTNPDTNMHRDQGANLFLKPKEDITENERYLAKNGFVFPEFYGDWWKSCAENLWPRIEASTKKHLKTQGIKKLEHFAEHVRKVEDKLWKESFPGYGEWRIKMWERYQKCGYVDLKTGFRCTGLMQRKEVTNYPIQGSAFHCTVWSFIQLEELLRTSKFKSTLIGQIHDEIVFDVVPDEYAELSVLIKDIMCNKIREHWPWIIVPLEVKADVYKINGNWSEQNENF